jgi:hypothetical protein
MDAMEIAKDITAAIISNPSYKPGSGKEEVKLFAAVLKEVNKVLGAQEFEEEEEESAGEGGDIASVRDVRVRRGLQ